MSNFPLENSGHKEPLTRERALEKLAECQDLQSVFDVANPALSVWRKGWGDDETASGVAALCWARCSFPVAAAANVRFKGATLAGDELVKAGLTAAKQVAAALLAPLPANGPDEKERPLSAKKKAKRYKRRYEAVRKAMESNSGAPPFLAKDKVGQIVFEFSRVMIQTALDLNKAIRPGGEGWRVASPSHICGSGLNALWILLQGGCLRSQAQEFGFDEWVGLSHCLVSDQELPHGALARAGKLAIECYGLGTIMAGPLNGGASALKEIELNAQRLGRLSELLRVDPQEMGLGGLAFSVNSAMNSLESHGFYHPAGHWMQMGRFGGSLSTLAHEWAHALDTGCQEARSTPAAQAAKTGLARFHREIQSAPVDQLVMQEVKNEALGREQGLKTLSYFLEKSGVVETSPKVGDLLERLEERVKGAGLVSDKVTSRAARELLKESGAPPEALIGFQSLARSVARRLKMYDRALSWESEGINAFCAWAKMMEESRVSPGARSPKGKRYWVDRHEKLARAMQGFVAQVDPASEASASSALPRGAEREAMAKAAVDWVSAARPLLRELSQGIGPVTPGPAAVPRRAL